MAIRKKNGLWYVSVYIGVKDGKQHYETGKKGYEKKSDAQLAEAEIKQAIIKSERKVYDKADFGRVAEIWLETRTSKAQSTYDRDKYFYKHYIEPKFGKRPVRDIDKIEIIAFMAKLKYAPETVSKIMNILKQILDFAIDMHMIRENPSLGIKKPRIKTYNRETWSEKEISKFLKLEDVKNSPAYTAFMILFTTGMRPGEVCGLRWVDLRKDHFVPTVGTDKKRRTTDLKNDEAHNNVYVSDSLLNHLKQLKSLHKELYFKNGVEFTPYSFICCLGPDMRAMTPEYLTKRFNIIVERNNLKKIRLYDSRHSFGTNMSRAGVNPEEVSEAMRHSSVKTTLDRYYSVDNNTKRKTFNNYAKKLL